MSPSQPPDEPTVWIETRYLRVALLGTKGQVAHTNQRCSRNAVTEILVRFGGVMGMVKCMDCFAEDYSAPTPQAAIGEIRPKTGLTAWLRALPMGEELVCPEEFFINTRSVWSATVRHLATQSKLTIMCRVDVDGVKYVRRLEK